MTHSEKISELLEKGILISPEELDNAKSNVEKSTQNMTSIDNDAKVKIVYSYNKSPKKRVVTDFFKYFNLRFKALEKIIRMRPEMEGLVSINKLKLKEERENVSIIGMIKEKSLTKNKNIILVLEDLTGQTSVLIHKNNNEAYTVGKDLVLDEVIGVIGSAGKNIVFSNKVIFPDVPMNKEFKKAPIESYAVFLGDFHFGSKVFLQKEFDKFLAWINGTVGSEEQKEIANKVKYIFFAGDLVEGVGVYPGQEEDLEIKDIKEQYAILSKSLSKIGSDKKLIICPGNHDAGRIAEPQPPLYNDFAEALWQLPNAAIVSNPAMINIGSTEDFSGLDVLLYHGYSLIYYANNVESIRNAGGQKRVDLIMKFLLQKRHLAPTHESNMYIPDAEEDPLVIDKIPDIFVTGHIHRASASEYRNITLLNTSCWSDITEDQEKRGLEPQPGRIFVMNLQTRKVKLINFYGR
ncbi:metallophosphoesterase [Candidatus Woesearchaeota archaeon]|nr:metallophosphoesterase [Candidatus Woesearchaeota archaeon]